MPADTPEGLRQEAQRALAELAPTVEELAQRVSARRLIRPAVAPMLTGLMVGVTTSVALRYLPGLRRVAWVGGLAAGTAAAVGTRRAAREYQASMVTPTAAVPGATPAAPVHEDPDVVTVLLEQHRQIEKAFAAVLTSRGQDRLEAVAELVELVHHHEHGEQRWVHPLLQSVAGDVVDARVAEEESAERMLSSLVSRGVDRPDFEAGLIGLQRLVLDHAAQEESREFPLLRTHVDVNRLRELAIKLRWTG
jgi:hypothetical protein